MKTHILTLLIVVSVAGCISDDYDDCDPAKIYFSYKGDGNTEILNRKINRVDLYVYDSDDCNILIRTVEKDELRQNQGVELDLVPGQYNVVCIANDYEDTQVLYNDDEEDFSDNYFTNPDYINNEEVSTNDSLYFGSAEITLYPPGKYRKADKTISFESSHIKMYIEIAGLDVSETKSSNMPYDLKIRNLQPLIDFTNTSFGNPIAYYPEAKYNPDSDIITARFNILRQTRYNDVIIDVLDDNELTIYSFHLMEFLEDRPNINLDNEEVLIAMRIELLENGDVNVTVPDWYIEHIDPEF